jgi:excisionase family DNA binding protein
MKEQANLSNGENLLSREQAARRLGISTRNLDYLREAGRLSFIQIGRRVIFSPTDLDQFIQMRRIEST